MHYIILPANESCLSIEIKTELDDYLWVDGKDLLSIDSSLNFEYTPENDAQLQLPDYVSPIAGIPLFSKKLRNVLLSNGVKNITYHDAVIKNISTQTVSNYYTVNILSLISCVDRNNSEFRSSFGSDLLIANFDHLEIDESTIENEHLFRLAERSTIALVSEKIKTAVEAAGLQGIEFIKPADWDCFSDTT